MTTPGSIVIPGALTIARSMQADPSDLMAAMAAGCEAMIRLGRVISGPDVLYRGIWPTYFSAPFGIAAVAARLLQFDANQTAHVLALAPALAVPGVGHPRSDHVALVRRRQRRPQRIDRGPCATSANR
jgi:2-methylcitrate dehydratase PrpD